MRIIHETERTLYFRQGRFVIGRRLDSCCTRAAGVKFGTFEHFAALQVFGRTLWSRKRIDSRVQRGALRLISKCIRNEH